MSKLTEAQRAPDKRETQALKLLDDCGGSIVSEDNRVDQFSGDREHLTDTWNRLFDIGWAKETHDSIADWAVIYITQAGRRALQDKEEE